MYGILALALALFALAVSAPALAQKVGSKCGPAYEEDYVWVAPALLKGTGSTPSKGCAASDKLAHAHVQAVMPQGTWSVHSVAFTATTSQADSKVTIMVGDADSIKRLDVLRGSDTLKSKLVLANFDTCAARKLATGAGKSTTIVCNPERIVDGSFVALFAPELKACNVLVCARQQLFNDQGVPLTRAAALMANAPNSMTPVNNPLTAAGLVKPAATPESCSGYTSSQWSACPKGQECVKTYKPGDGVCKCWHCSAFSDIRTCEQGDTSIGSVKCCFTCPPQPVCAVCQTPCNPTFDRIEVIPGVLPTTPESYNTLAYSYTSTTTATNLGNNAQTITVTFSISQSLTATMEYAESFEYSEKSTLKLGIPFLGEKAELEFGATQTFTTTTTNTDSKTNTYTTELQQEIPALTVQEVTAKASAGMITVKAPVTIKTYYTCDKVDTKETYAIIKTEGTINTVASKLQVTYGPQYPLNPPIVYNATATCASNPVCADYGLTGNCCPGPDGVYKTCCSMCFLKEPCKDIANDNTTMCCPTNTNKWSSCCGIKPTGYDGGDGVAQPAGFP